MLFTCLSHIWWVTGQSPVSVYIMCIACVQTWAHHLWSKNLVLVIRVSVCLTKKWSLMWNVLLIKFFHCVLKCYLFQKPSGVSGSLSVINMWSGKFPWKSCVLSPTPCSVMKLAHLPIETKETNYRKSSSILIWGKQCKLDLIH